MESTPSGSSKGENFESDGDTIELELLCGEDVKSLVNQFFPLTHSYRLGVQQYPSGKHESVPFKGLFYDGKDGVAERLRNIRERDASKATIFEFPACGLHWFSVMDSILIKESGVATGDRLLSVLSSKHSRGCYNDSIPANVYYDHGFDLTNNERKDPPSLFVSFSVIHRRSGKLCNKRKRAEKALNKLVRDTSNNKARETVEESFWKTSVGYLDLSSEEPSFEMDSKGYNFGPQALFEHVYPTEDTWAFNDTPTSKQLLNVMSEGEEVFMVEPCWVVIYPSCNTLLVFSDNGSKESSHQYSRQDAVKKLGLGEIKGTTSSGVMLDGALCVSELLLPEEKTSHVSWYQEQVKRLTYRFYHPKTTEIDTLDPLYSSDSNNSRISFDSSESPLPNFDKAERELDVIKEVCKSHVKVLSDLRKAYRSYFANNEQEDSKAIVHLLNYVLVQKEREMETVVGIYDSVKRQQKLISNDMNTKVQRRKIEVAQRLEAQSRYVMIFTMITGVFLPLGFLTSYFGMNGVEIPGAQMVFWIVSILIVAIAVAVFGIMKFIRYRQKVAMHEVSSGFSDV